MLEKMILFVTAIKAMKYRKINFTEDTQDVNKWRDV